MSIGEYNRRIKDGERFISVKNYTIHPLYTKSVLYDVALLVLSDKIEFKRASNGYGSVDKISLPRKCRRYANGQEVTLAGWGRIDNDDSQPIFSDVLRFIKLTIDDTADKICKSEEYVCTNTEGKRPHDGDSGSGLFLTNENGTTELVGIASQVERETNIAYFTNIAKHLNWIQRSMAKF